MPSTLHVPTAPVVSESALLHSIAGIQQLPDRRRGGSSAREGSHRGGGVASPNSRIRQQHLPSAEEEWQDAPSHQFEETECSTFGYPALQDGSPQDVRQAIRPGD
jgi:hypothetical protein